MTGVTEKDGQTGRQVAVANVCTEPGTVCAKSLLAIVVDEFLSALALRSL